MCGVILAAGTSSRMGRDKALLPWPPRSSAASQTFLSAIIKALSAFNDMVVVVVGENESALAPHIYAEGASLVRNPAPERGQFSSMQVGLQQVLDYGRDAAMITLVDRPPAAYATLEQLCRVFIGVPDETWAVVPEYNGKHGHPFLVDRAMIAAFMKGPPEGTARDVEHDNQQHIQYLKVDDPLVVLNVNTLQEYEALS
jgi:molybdenum cofactor cytidylyltransferase